MIAGTTKRAATSSAPTTVRAATIASATRPSSTASKSRGLGPVESTSVGSKPARSQCWPIKTLARSVATAAPAASRRSPLSTSSRLPKQQRLDVRAGAEHVAGEDHASGEAGDEDQCDHRVLARAPAAECRRARGEGDGGAEGPEGSSEAEPVGEHQPREGRGADRVGEEGEAAQHDPGAEQAGRDGEDQHLDQPALDEGKLEGLKQRDRSFRGWSPQRRGLNSVRESNENESSLHSASDIRRKRD